MPRFVCLVCTDNTVTTTVKPLVTEVDILGIKYRVHGNLASRISVIPSIPKCYCPHCIDSESDSVSRMWTCKAAASSLHEDVSQHRRAVCERLLAGGHYICGKYDKAVQPARPGTPRPADGTGLPPTPG